LGAILLGLLLLLPEGVLRKSFVLARRMAVLQASYTRVNPMGVVRSWGRAASTSFLIESLRPLTKQYGFLFWRKWTGFGQQSLKFGLTISNRAFLMQ
jgi:hypothetical protein